MRLILVAWGLSMSKRTSALPCIVLLAALGTQSAISSPWADACTRVTYLGPDDNVITARSMDWAVDVGTDLWIFPRGMQRNGEAGPRSLAWTSKYGSVIATGYDISTTDGMNEKGLVANML
jgi:penicillin V acylase-like amidase (Ntn superfamily)